MFRQPVKAEEKLTITVGGVTFTVLSEKRTVLIFNAPPTVAIKRDRPREGYQVLKNSQNHKTQRNTHG